MTFDQVEFFMSCASCLNFSLAAKYHFVSVSTLSRRITNLEDELGVKLFERGYHGHKLTDAGADFYECCINSYMMHNVFLNKWSPYSKEYISVGCCPYDSSYEKLIISHSKASPDFLTKKLKINLIPEEKILNTLRGRDISAAVINEEKAVGEDLIIVPFYKENNKNYVIVYLKDFDSNIAIKFSRLGTYLK